MEQETYYLRGRFSLVSTTNEITADNLRYRGWSIISEAEFKRARANLPDYLYADLDVMPDVAKEQRTKS